MYTWSRSNISDDSTTNWSICNAKVDISIRGYVQSEDTSLELAEALGANVESATTEFASEQQANGVADARVVSFRTDEGLFDPYGVADQDVQILYDVEANL